MPDAVHARTPTNSVCGAEGGRSASYAEKRPAEGRQNHGQPVIPSDLPLRRACFKRVRESSERRVAAAWFADSHETTRTIRSWRKYRRQYRHIRRWNREPHHSAFPRGWSNSWEHRRAISRQLGRNVLFAHFRAARNWRSFGTRSVAIEDHFGNVSDWIGKPYTSIFSTPKSNERGVSAIPAMGCDSARP